MERGAGVERHSAEVRGNRMSPNGFLFQKSYRTQKPCKEEHPRGLAETMSLAMGEVSEKIIRDVYAALKERK